MTPGWSSGPPPHERGLSAPEQENRDREDPNYDYCVVRKNYDVRTQQVWFTASAGPCILGRSPAVAHKRSLFGRLARFDRDLEAAYNALVQTLVRNGWEPVCGDPQETVTTFRRLKPIPGDKPPR